MQAGGSSAGGVVGGGSAGGVVGGGSAGGPSGGGNAGGVVVGGGTAPGCVAGTWCWEHPLPAGYGLNAVFIESPSTAWAVGQRGSVLRLDGTTWRAVPRVTDHDLEVLTGTPTNLFALGERDPLSTSMSSSRVLRYDGSRWSVVPHGPNPLVRRVSAASDGEAWLLTSGNSTLITPELLRWSGSAFVAVPGPQGLTPVQLCVRSATEVWVTASASTGAFPTSLHRWNGSSWALVHQFTAASSRRFEGFLGCPADGVAVSAAYEFNGRADLSVEVKNGVVQLAPVSSWTRVLVTPHNDVFVAKNRDVEQWTPGGWQPRFQLAANTSAYSASVDFQQSNGLLADGTTVLSTWTGQGFTPLRGRVGTLHVAVSPRGAQVDPVALFGSGTFATRVGQAWSFRPTPMVTGAPLEVTAAWAPAAGDVWLVGTAIARFNVQTGLITPVVTLPNAEYARFTAIDGVDEQSLWAAGFQTDVAGLLVRRFDGQAWVAPPVPVPTRVDGLLLNEVQFTGVDVLSANDVMLLGNDPAGGRFVSTFYRWNGSAWTAALTAGDTVTLFDRDPQGGVYVVEGSTVKRANALDDRSTWQPLGDVPGSAVKLRVLGVNQLEVVARDSDTTGLYRWDAAASRFVLVGQAVDAPFITDVVSGAATPAGRRLWAIGAEGALLSLSP